MSRKKIDEHMALINLAEQQAWEKVMRECPGFAEHVNKLSPTARKKLRSVFNAGHSIGYTNGLKVGITS